MLRFFFALLALLGLKPPEPTRIPRQPTIGITKSGQIAFVWLNERQPVRHMTAVVINDKDNIKPRDSPVSQS